MTPTQHLLALCVELERATRAGNFRLVKRRTAQIVVGVSMLTREEVERIDEMCAPSDETKEQP